MADSHPHSETISDLAAQRRATNLRGIVFLLVGMGAFALNDALTKSTSGELPTGQIVAIRGVFACVLLTPVMFATVGVFSLRRVYSWPVIIRNASEVLTVFFFLNALFRLPIANVTAILQALPLVMTAAAAILFKEPVGWRRWLAAGVGLLGVLLIVRPGSGAFSWWYVSAFVAMLLIVVRDISTRYIQASASTLTLTYLTAVVVTLSGFAFGLTEDWVMPSPMSWAKLAGAAVAVCVAYYATTECWRGTDIAVISPFRYSIVIWALMLGYLLLGEVPSTTTLAGAAIVVGAGLYTLRREQVVKRR